jgi:hypothetical protein
MIYFTTYFDKNYLGRGLVLFDSLREHSGNFKLFILALDEFTANYFQQREDKFPEVVIITLGQLEAWDPSLPIARNNRSLIEYYFTLSPCLPLFLLKKYELAHICSLDADILFLNDPKRLLDCFPEYSIIITPHKFSPQLKYLDKFGIYNVSFQVFKNDQTGLECLEKWRSQCIHWCYDEYDEKHGRFADQKYLDEWMDLYPGKVKALYDDVSGLAPWNLNNYKIEKKNSHFYSNGQRIIFYHFHHFKLFGGHWASNIFNFYDVKWQAGIKQLYVYYWNKLHQKKNELLLLSEQSNRFNYSDKFLVNLFQEPSAYFRLSSKKAILVKLNWVPSFIKNLIVKLYA